MDSFKNLQNTLLQSSVNLSRSRTDYFFTILFTLILICFFFLFSASDNTSPAVTCRSLASRLHSPPNKLSPLSSAVFPDARFASRSYRSCTVSATFSPAETCHQIPKNAAEEETDACDVFDGHWVVDEDLEPVYKPGSCPFIDDAFNCFKNGRPDSDYLRLKWKPHACEIPRF